MFDSQKSKSWKVDKYLIRNDFHFQRAIGTNQSLFTFERYYCCVGQATLGCWRIWTAYEARESGCSFLMARARTQGSNAWTQDKAQATARTLTGTSLCRGILHQRTGPSSSPLTTVEAWDPSGLRWELKRLNLVPVRYRKMWVLSMDEHTMPWSRPICSKKPQFTLRDWILLS